MKLPVERWLPPAQMYDASTTLFRQGDTAHAVYIIASGVVQLSQRRNGREVVVGLRQVGRVLGLEVGRTDEEYMTSASVLVPSRVHRLTSDAFRRLAETETEFARLFLETLSEELRTCMDEHALFVALPPARRVGDVLDLIAAAQGTKEPATPLVLPPLLDRAALADLSHVPEAHLDDVLPELEDWSVLPVGEGPLTFLRRGAAPFAGAVPHQAGDARIGIAMRIIEQRYMDPGFDLAHLSRPMNLSRWHASRVFKRTTGMRSRQALNAVRVAQARTLLATTSLSVKEIAASVGFNYVSDLSRKFRAIYRTSPTAYRAAYRLASGGEPEAIQDAAKKHNE